MHNQIERWTGICATALFIGTLLPSVSAGQVNFANLIPVDDSVQVQLSALRYDRRTHQTSCTATVTNTSSEPLQAPVYLAIESISAQVEDVANADGTSEDGMPYFVIVAEGEFAPGASTFARVAFTNPQRLRFTFESSVYVEPALEIVLDQGLSSITLEEGTLQYIAYAITLTGTAGHAYNVIFQQTISPDDGGIAISSDYPGGWSTSNDITWVVNEFIDGLSPGSYTVTSTATVVETGDSTSTELIVNVVEAGAEVALLWPPGADPDGVAPNTPTDVTFTVLLSGVSVPPASLLLQQVDAGGVPVAAVGDLVDDGQNGDLVAHDQVYTCILNISTGALSPLYYRASVLYDGHMYVSPDYALTVTQFPVGPAMSDLAELVQDGGSGEWLYADELLVAFVDGTSLDRIQEIVSGEGAIVAGTIPALGVYELTIPGDGTPTGVAAAIAAFESYSEVEYAEANYLEEEEEFTPNDSKFGSQSNMTVIRADEAWVVAKGSVLIAVVDTGVDYDHEDLDAKVIKGKDYVDDDDDPADGGTHGTHVAGIAAAESNNGMGVAGAAWDSKILAIRSIGGGGHKAFAAGVRYAADNGAKIINYSGSGTDSKTKHKAVKYAVNKGCLFVCAAGNNKGNTKVYPAAYDEVLCVGNSTDADGRAGSSNYGTWVDLAAPGVSVMSTVPGNNYATKTGTSMSTPLVSGAAAVVWSMHPKWTAAQVRTRLEKTVAPVAANLLIGVGRIDLFEAVFNGSFEIGDLSEWSATGTCSSLEKLGPLEAQHRKRMGYCSTGPASDQVAATLEKSFTVQSGVTSIPIKFEYDFVTEEYPEWVGTIYNDALRIVLTAPDGTETELAVETVNGSTFYPIDGIDFPGGDDTVGHTNWKTATATVPVTQGPGTYTIHVTDAGDDIYDSVVLIDNIRLKH